jgi:hypothetical protein
MAYSFALPPSRLATPRWSQRRGRFESKVQSFRLAPPLQKRIFVELS